jgi:predicted RNA methylase
MTIYSEKDVDHIVKTKFEKLGFYYFTTFQIEPFKTLFGCLKTDSGLASGGNLIPDGERRSTSRLQPDGSMVHNSNLMIIENKKSLKQEPEALKQLLKYCNSAVSNGWNENIYCVFGCVDCIKIFVYNRKSKALNPENMKLSDLLNSKFSKIEATSEALFHDLHNFIVSNMKIDDNNELCFLCLAVLLTTMKINIHTASDELIFGVIQKIIMKELNELSTLIQDINPANISILVKKIYNLYAVAGKDVYLKLYQEFCRYSKAKDEKNIVLTPDWIVKLMVNELKLDDSYPSSKILKIFDPCVGTGSLIMGITNPNCILYGCEVNRKMYVLCKGLFILSNPEFKVFHADAFKLNLSEKFDGEANGNSGGIFDGIIMNPPYSKKQSKHDAIEFVTYSIEHFLKVNGILVAIFPTAQLKTIKAYQKYKDYIFKNCNILKVINLGMCFKDAGVECSILVVQKTEKSHNTPNTLVFNMKMSKVIAYKVPRGEMKFTELGKDLLNKIMNNETLEFIDENISRMDIQITNSEMDWTCLTVNNDIRERLESELIQNKLSECKLSLIQFIDLNFLSENFNFEEFNNIIRNALNDVRTSRLTIGQTNYKECKITELFELITKYPKHATHGKNELEGYYPLISATIKNNGVIKHISTFDFDGEYLIVVTGTFSKAGLTTYHNEKFSVTSHVKVLKPKVGSGLTSSDLIEISKMMSMKLPEVYSINNPLTIEKLLSETIYVKEYLD